MILQVIWEDAIQRELGIDLIDLPQYRAVLVIPSLYKYAHNLKTYSHPTHLLFSRSLIKHLISLLLSKIGFGGCFAVQVSLFFKVGD